MKTLASLAFVIAVAAFADVPTDYDFTVRVMPTAKDRLIVHVVVNAPDGTFSGSSETASIPPVQTMTLERGGRTYTIVLRMESEILGSADFEVKENGTVIAHATKAFSRPIVEQPADGTYVRISEGIVPPVVIKRVEPVYPKKAREARVSGIVILETKISDSGAVDDVRVMRGLSPELDQAAVDAVKRWKFRPAMREGKAVGVVFNLTISFRLSEAPLTR